MSATNRGATRNTFDQYPTPPWCVDRLMDEMNKGLKKLSIVRPGTWCEPCCGDGNIVKAVNRWRAKNTLPRVEWQLYDIDPKYGDGMADLVGPSGHSAVLDFTTFNHHATKPFDVTITNPPYSHAQEIAEVCFRTSNDIFLLLRVNFLGSKKRHPFYRKYGVPDLLVLPNRPPYVENPEGGSDTDATEYAWFHWDETILRHDRAGQTYVLDLTPDVVVKYTKRAAAAPKKSEKEQLIDRMLAAQGEVDDGEFGPDGGES